MRPHIRLFTPDDYESISAINNAVYPEYPDTPDEWRFYDEHRDPKCKWQRWVAECDGQVVGVGFYNHMTYAYHPRKFSCGIDVHPEYQGRGVGKALYQQVARTLDTFEPILIRSRTRADQPRSIRFLLDRDFTESHRDWESRLDVAAFDLTPYAGYQDRVLAHGIEIRTIRELESDPDRNRKLWQLESTLGEDVPSHDPPTSSSFEYFVESQLGSPNLLQDAYFVAVHNGEYVGSTALWKSEASDDLYNGLTGVRRDYRRKGIALALKMRGIAYAKQQNRPVIKTWNDSSNRPMLSINERLGFVKQPAWINYVKVLREEE